MQHLIMVNQFLEDMTSVSLSSLSICFTEHLELQSSKIFSVMLSHISQLFLNSHLGLERTCLPTYQVNHRYQILLYVSCLPKFPYVSCTSVKTQCLPNGVFYILTELAIKRCNNQSKAIYIIQQHPIASTIIIIDFSYLMKIW